MTTRISRDELAQRIAADIPEGSLVNLGIGAPTLVANFLPQDEEIILHTENGLLGMGEAPGSSVTGSLPALMRSGSASPSTGAGPMPSMPFSVWKTTPASVGR